MSDFQIGAAFRATMDQLREGGLASIFLALVSVIALVALMVILSFGFFSGIDMFDAVESGIAGPLGIVAILLFVLFFGLAYCAAVMAVFRHSVDGYRADFVSSLAYGWKAAFPVLGVMMLIYFAMAFAIGIFLFLLVGAVGGFTGGFEKLSLLEDMSVGIVVFVIAIYFVSFIVVGLFIPARLGLAGPVMAAQNRLNPFWAMGRSWSMTRGNSWKLMGYLFLVSVGWLVIYFIIGLIAVGLNDVGFGYAEYLTIYPYSLAYLLLYNMVISGIYVQLSGGALAGAEEIEDVFG